MSKRILDDQFIHRLENLTFQTQKPMRGFFGGNHKTTSYGQTVEFADFRDYVLGDDLRHIDWNLYSRFEKHFVKLFVDERQMHTKIFLDCSASLKKIDDQKANLMLKIAASIGYLTVHNMDRLSFYAMHENQAKNVVGLITSKPGFYRSIQPLESLSFKGSVDIEACIRSVKVSSNDGLTILISDFLTDSNWKKAVDYLLYQKREVLLIQILSKEDIQPKFSGRMRLMDVESTDLLDSRNLRMNITKGHLQAYQAALKDYLDDMKTFTNKRGVHLIQTTSDEAVEKVVFKELLKVGTVV